MNRGRFRLMRAGLVPYEQAWEVQRELADAVRRGAEPVLLLLEHPPVFTLGKHGDAANVLAAGGIPVIRTDRGGDVTYHGPGQLVGYPILNLKTLRIGIRDHVCGIQKALRAALSDFGVAADTCDGKVGVWTARGKIASLGVRVDRGVSMHGFALNVSADLAPFRRIHPCGEAGAAVTSIREELRRPVGVAEAADRFLPRFAAAVRFDAWDERPASFACGPA